MPLMNEVPLKEVIYKVFGEPHSLMVFAFIYNGIDVINEMT